MFRIETKEQLLEYCIRKYSLYREAFVREPSAVISKYYINDFLQDLLYIQRFAATKEDQDEISTEQSEGVAIL